MILSYFSVIEINLLYCEKFKVCSCLCTTILLSKPFLTGRINKNKLINTRSVIYSIDNLTLTYIEKRFPVASSFIKERPVIEKKNASL